MSKQKKFVPRPKYDEDGMKQQSVKDLKRDRDRKKNRNFDNALRSRNIDMLSNFEDD
jgi:hypothetical protein